ATLEATRTVLDGRAARAFAPAGGLHHAHRDRVAGFCIYNDCVIAIERATRDRSGIRVAYVDIDAHHGDGVQEAFYERPDVLTLSVHESGSYLYPGTGHPRETGTGPGAGHALNVALPPYAHDRCYAHVLDAVIAPALHAFDPDLVFLQGGADTYLGDPLTHLALSVAGYSALIAGVIRLAEDVCGGRIVMVGGGGYEPFSAVPRMWACAMAHLLGVPVPPAVPDAWLARAREHVRDAAPGTFDACSPPPPGETAAEALRLTEKVCKDLAASHPLLTGRDA
ncbi:acetoin utilization protein AcuC, partial [bacterium]|nr:acetoin utilization protein AcuC [bacterium]